MDKLPYDFDLLFDIKTIPQLETKIRHMLINMDSMISCMKAHGYIAGGYECAECCRPFTKVFKGTRLPILTRCSYEDCDGLGHANYKDLPERQQV